MVKNIQNTSVVRLLVQFAMILVAVAVAWGLVSHQVTDSAEDIVEIRTIDLVKIDNDKLDKEVFGMYIEQQEKADVTRDKTLERMEGKLDKALEK